MARLVWPGARVLPTFQAEFLLVLACRDLIFEPPDHLEHSGFQCVVAGGCMDVGPRHRHLHGCAERRGRVWLVFQHDQRRADRDDLVQLFKVLLNEPLGHCVVVQAMQLVLDLHVSFPA